MARVKINLPDNFLFSTSIDIRIGDVNYGGHVGNDAILALAHEARVRFFQSMGYSELDLGGVGVIMADSAIVYKGESFYGDTININVGIQDISRLGFDIVYEMKEAKGKDIALVKTGMVCFNYEQRKVTALPEEVKNKLNG